MRMKAARIFSALKKGIGALALLAVVGTANATILVEFQGAVDSFNPGPLTALSPIEGSFSIDDSLLSTGAGMTRTFSGSINDLSITIDDSLLGPLAFFGQGGDLTQFCQVNPPGTPPNDSLTPCDPGTRFVSVGVGGSEGTVTGNADSYDFVRVSFDLRGTELFDNPFNVANNLTRDGPVDDFGYARMTMSFDGISFGLERSLDTIRFSAIPEPSTALLIGAGLCGMAAMRRSLAGH